MGRKRKYTEQDYINLANSRGFKWTGIFPININAKTGWECSVGHIWSATYHHISRGTGCPKCARTERYTESDYRELADRLGITWIGPLPPNTLSCTAWRCKTGHVWNAVFSNISRSRGCPQCSGKYKRIEADYIGISSRRGIKFIGPVPPNAKTPTAWECGNGHIWNARFSDISSGYGCPECARNKIRLSEPDYRKLADRRGFVWVGPLPRNTQTCTKWKCGSGHIWSASFGGIYSGNGCPRCSGKARITDYDYRTIGQSRGIEWIGAFPDNAHMKTTWKCSRGHAWMAAYNTIKRSGCRKCYEMDNRGEKHSNFRGGNLAFFKKYGNGFNERRKNEVRMRDNHTCMLTGEYLGGRRKRPDVHHIVSARIAPREWKNSMHNLIVLSRVAHIWAEKNPKESIPALRKILYDAYGYSFSDMQDYDISQLTMR